jgi:hypothetical protein
MLLAVSLWATDFLHHLNPAVIAIGVGLCLTLPHLGLLNAQALKQMPFLLICFLAGALSVGKVLTETKALNFLMDGFVSWLAPLLMHEVVGVTVLYWSAFLYHFILVSDQGMTATSLPVLLELAKSQGYNPVAVGLAWTFATTGKLFVYQHSAIGVAYAYGYFTGKDWCKVSAVLSLLQGLILMVLVPVYWPLIGLPWRPAPLAAQAPATATPVDGVAVPGPVPRPSPEARGTHRLAQPDTRTATAGFPLQGHGTLQAVLMTSQVRVGHNRVAFALLCNETTFIADADVVVRPYTLHDPQPQLYTETRAFYEPLAVSGRGPQTEPEMDGLYVAQVTFDRPGLWGFAVLVAQDDGPVAVSRFTAEVLAVPRTPRLGASAP